MVLEDGKEEGGQGGDVSDAVVGAFASVCVWRGVVILLASGPENADEVPVNMGKKRGGTNGWFSRREATTYTWS